MRNGRPETDVPKAIVDRVASILSKTVRIRDQSKPLICLYFSRFPSFGLRHRGSVELPCTICRKSRGNCRWNRSAGLAFCAARCMLLQCGSERFPRVTAALLGRFLPRLGPLAMRAALFLSLELGQVAYSAAAR